MSQLNPRLKDDLDVVFGQHGWRQIPNYKNGEKKMSEENTQEVVASEVVEVIEESSELSVAQSNSLNTNIFGTTNPADFVNKSQEYAKALVDVVENQQLYANIQGKKYVTFEGWQFLGSMLPTAITPQTEWTTEIRDESTGEVLGYKTRVIAKDVNGNERGAAESVCMYAEKNWKGKDANHLMSMAQTRASSKALRMALSSIVKLAGYEPTPKEEMDGITAENSFNNSGSSSSSQGSPQASPDKSASEAQLNFIKSLINQNATHEIVTDPGNKSLLEAIGKGDISSALASSIIKWVKGEIPKLDVAPF